MRWQKVPHQDARYDRYGEFPIITGLEMVNEMRLIGSGVVDVQSAFTVYAYWRRDRERRRAA